MHGTARGSTAGRGEMARGAAAMAPLLVGVAPFGLLVGAAAAATGDVAARWAGTWLIFSGSAHLAVMRLLDDGAGLGVVVFTGLLLQARLLVYSATLAPTWRHEPLRRRLLLAATVVDPTWAVGTARHDRAGTAGDKRRFYAGAALALWASWTVLVAAGMALGDQVRSASWLGLALPVSLVTMLAPHLRVGDGRWAVAAAAVATVFTLHATGGVSVLSGAAAAAVAGSVSRSARTDTPAVAPAVAPSDAPPVEVGP